MRENTLPIAQSTKLMVNVLYDISNKVRKDYHL